jgi:hypothetical protein
MKKEPSLNINHQLLILYLLIKLINHLILSIPNLLKTQKLLLIKKSKIKIPKLTINYKSIIT